MSEENEVSLYDYIKVISKWKWFIIIGTSVCILTAGIVTLLLPRVYETRATLAVEGSVTPDVEIGILSVPTGLSLDKFFNFLPNNRDLNLEVIRSLGLDKSPDELTPQALSETVTFSLDKDSRTITINTRYNHPEKAKDIADTMAEVVKEHYQVLNEAEILQSQALIDEQLNLARASLLEAEKNLEAFEETVDVDSLKIEIQARVSQETSLTEEYSSITIFLVEEEAGLARTEEEIEKIDEQLSLARASLLEAEKNLESFKETVDVDSLKIEIQARVSQETSLTEEYSSITIFLVEEEAGLARTEEEIEKIDEQLSLARASLLEAEKNLESFKETVDVDSLKKEIQARVSQETSLTQEYSQIMMFLVEEEAGLATTQEELQKQDRFYVLSKSIAEDPSYEDILARLSKEDIAALQAVKGESQQINPVYLNLEQIATNARISVARAKAKKLLVTERIEENRVASSKLRLQLAEREGEWEHLTEAHNLAKKLLLKAQIEENRVASSKLRLQLAEREREWEHLTEAHNLAKELLLKAKIEENRVALSKLQAQLSENEPEWVTLTEGYALTNKEYQSISNSHQGAAELLAAAKVRQLRTVGTAGAPPGPDTKRVLLIAAAVGLLATLFLAFFLDYIGRMRKLEAESKKQRN